MVCVCVCVCVCVLPLYQSICMFHCDTAVKTATLYVSLCMYIDVKTATLCVPLCLHVH